MFHRTPCFSAGAPLQGRTCVSDTINDGPATAATGADTAANANGNGSAPRRRSGGGLAGKLLPELQQLAGDLGITGTAKMRKSELIAAIQARQSGGANGGAPTAEKAVPRQDEKATDNQAAGDRPRDGSRGQRDGGQQTQERDQGNRGQTRSDQNRGDQNRGDQNNRGDQSSRGDQNTRTEPSTRGDQGGQNNQVSQGPRTD